MGEVKQHQPPMTIDEQIENLKNIGLMSKMRSMRKEY